MTGSLAHGNPDACERAANDCDRAAHQLNDPIQRLTTLRGSANGAWRGDAGDSLVRTLETRRQGLVQAQSDLRNAAGRLRSAAAQIREAIRRERERQAVARRAPMPTDKVVA
jgi:uncharacterized protein YukE